MKFRNGLLTLLALSLIVSACNKGNSISKVPTKNLSIKSEAKLKGNIRVTSLPGTYYETFGGNGWGCYKEQSVCMIIVTAHASSIANGDDILTPETDSPAVVLTLYKSGSTTGVDTTCQTLDVSYPSADTTLFTIIN